MHGATHPLASKMQISAINAPEGSRAVGIAPVVLVWVAGALGRRGVLAHPAFRGLSRLQRNRAWRGKNASPNAFPLHQPLAKRDSVALASPQPKRDESLRHRCTNNSIQCQMVGQSRDCQTLSLKPNSICHYFRVERTSGGQPSAFASACAGANYPYRRTWHAPWTAESPNVRLCIRRMHKRKFPEENGSHTSDSAYAVCTNGSFKRIRAPKRPTLHTPYARTEVSG